MYEVRVTKLDEGKLLGLASMVVDGEFAFSGIRLLATDNPDANKGRGYNVVMPSYKTQKGDYVPFFKPVTKNMHDKLAYSIHKAFETGDAVEFGSENQELSVSVKPLNKDIQDEGTKKADVSISFNKEFVCDSISVRENISSGELFVAYPSYKSSKVDGDYKSICNPITKDFREKISQEVLGRLEAPAKDKGVELPKGKDAAVQRKYSKQR